MPSYNLTKDIRDVIQRRFLTAMNDYCTRSQSGFPLHAERMQDAILTEEFVPTWEAMKEGRAAAIGTTILTVALLRKDFPISRAACVTLRWGPQWAAYQPDMSAVRIIWVDREFSQCDGVSYLHRLTDAEREAVAEWAERAVQAERLYRMAVKTYNILMDRINTTACLMNTWPMLATFVDEGKWKERFRSPPQKNYLDKYHLPRSMMELYTPRIKLIDGALAMSAVLAGMVQEPNLEAGDIVASVRRYQGDGR